jgi:hypothetical protein
VSYPLHLGGPSGADHRGQGPQGRRAPSPWLSSPRLTAEQASQPLQAHQWQRFTLDHGLARDGDRFRYWVVVLTVARQNGKSVVLRLPKKVRPTGPAGAYNGLITAECA